MSLAKIASWPLFDFVGSIIVSRQIGQIHPPIFFSFFLLEFWGELPEGLERFWLALASILRCLLSLDIKLELVAVVAYVTNYCCKKANTNNMD